MPTVDEDDGLEGDGAARRTTIDRIAVHVSPAAERAVQTGFPWVYDDQITRLRRAGKPGDLAILFDRRDRFMGFGLFDPHSPIRVRVLHAGEQRSFDEGFLRERLRAAIMTRSVIGPETTAYRLINGENDGFGGVIVDRYDRTLVVKIYTAAWVPHLESLRRILLDATDAQRIVVRTSRGAAAAISACGGLRDGTVLHGTPIDGGIEFLENGLTFRADVLNGQKTGFFLDQRDNRRRVEGLAASRSVLNVCCYTGGFSVYAARGGADSVTSLDVSKPALEDAVRNFESNAGDERVRRARHEVVAGDAFEVMGSFAREGRRFGLVILDPPSFAKRKEEVEGAVNAYRRLANFGAALLSDDGILVAASCSSRVGAEEFFRAVHSGAGAAAVRLDEIERTFHAIDHPVTFELGRYLKCLFARVR